MYGYPGDPDGLDISYPDGDYDPSDLDDMTFEIDQRTIDTCPHGYPWADCNECMSASDFAYDAARETGFVRW